MGAVLLRSRLWVMLMGIALAGVVRADPAPFDLAGPALQVLVNRAGTGLPISSVPALAAGDQLRIKADLPSNQSEHYLLVVAFLRGSTNPPPENWFFPCETWTGVCAKEGLNVTVPAGAQQVIVFLAPATGGDFKTLQGAVRGRPGAFVRASQDLNQATLDRSRLQLYLAAVQTLSQNDPEQLKDVVPLLSRSLAIKTNDKCFDNLLQQQGACLTQSRDSLILNDGHSTSIVEALTTGPASDLAMEASYTPQLSYGYYSPYIASVLDIVRILGSFHTAQYQYIPALATLRADQMNLALNAPPSFHSPKSVLVAALPAIEPPQLPPLHAVDPKASYCARKGSLVVPVEGAPLSFSTAYAHDLTLRVMGADGRPIDLPATADVTRGGFVIDTAGLKGVKTADSMPAVLRGYWGFDDYTGPTITLSNVQPQTWNLVSGADSALVVGRTDVVHLHAGNVACVESVSLLVADGSQQPLEWKASKADQLEVTLPLQDSQPGMLTLLISQFGAAQPQSVALQAFTEAAHLDRFALHAGDANGVLQGRRLDEVASLLLKGVRFAPGKLTSSQGQDELAMTAQDAAASAALNNGDSADATVTLKDGRVFNLATTIDTPRPSVALLGKNVQWAAGSADHIQLTDANELPQDGLLTFSVRAQSPSTFARDEKIEVASLDQSFSSVLTVGNAGLMLEDAQVAVATLDPHAAFGASAFGPLQFRVIAGGASGDWQPLTTLVRLPVLRELTCPATPELACKLSGSDLFLVDAISIDPQFAHPVQVPDGFPGYSLPVPRPVDGRLYLRLRDNPTAINQSLLTMQQLPPTPEEAERAATRQEAAVKPAAVSEASSPAPAATPATPAPAGSGTPAIASPPGAALQGQGSLGVVVSSHSG